MSRVTDRATKELRTEDGVSKKRSTPRKTLDRMLSDGSVDLSIDLEGHKSCQVESQEVIHSLTLHNCQQLESLDLSQLDGPRFLYVNGADCLSRMDLTGQDSARWMDQTQIHLNAEKRVLNCPLVINGAVGHLDADFAGMRFDSNGFVSACFNRSVSWEGVDLYPVTNSLGALEKSKHQSRRLLVLIGSDDEPASLTLKTAHTHVLVSGTSHLQSLARRITTSSADFQIQLNDNRRLSDVQVSSGQSNIAQPTKSRLLSRGCPKLSFVDIRNVDFMSLSDVHTDSLEVTGLVETLLLTQVRTGHLRVEQLKNLELSNSGLIGALTLPPVFRVKVLGAKPPSLKVDGELFLNESSLNQLRETFATDQKAAVDYFRGLVCHAKDKKTAMILLRMLWSFFQQGLSIKDVWQLRTELNQHNSGHSKAWKWNLPSDLRVEGWSMDFRIWMSACLELTDAEHYATAICHTLRLTETGYKQSRDARRIVVKYLLPELKALKAEGQPDQQLAKPYQKTLIQALASPSWLESGDLDLVLRYLAEAVAYGGPLVYAVYMGTLRARIYHLVKTADKERVEVLLSVMCKALSPLHKQVLRDLPGSLIQGVNKCSPEPGWDDTFQLRSERLAQTVRAFALSELRRKIQQLGSDSRNLTDPADGLVSLQVSDSESHGDRADEKEKAQKRIYLKDSDFACQFYGVGPAIKLPPKDILERLAQKASKSDTSKITGFKKLKLPSKA